MLKLKIRISYCVHCENKTLLKFLKDQYLRSVNKNKNYKKKYDDSRLE